MRIKLSRTAEYLVYFINFIGFSAVIAILMSLGFTEDSRLYTIPIRLLEIVLIGLLLIFGKFRPGANPMVYVLLLWFFGVYFIKVFVEIIYGTSELFMPPKEFFLYAIIYAIIPFIFFSQRIKQENYDLMFNAIYLSGIIFSIASVVIFLKTIIATGKFDRFHSVFDPLTYSYTGAFIIGVCLMKLLFGKNEIKKTKLIIGILFGMAPFLIGGSRGPIVALLIPVIISYIYYYRSKIKLVHISYALLLITILIFATTWFGDLSFKRLFNILKDLESGSVEVIRLKIWGESFTQFLSSPIWGDSIQKVGGSYPHNLLIEVLMSTGIIGFIPYFTLLIFAFYKSIRILKFNPSNGWVFFIFVFTFFMGMLSGNIVSDIWYWSTLGLVLSYNYSVGQFKDANI